MSVHPKVMDRIKKLYAMAESAKAIGSLEEADSFMRGVEATLRKHNLEMADLDAAMQEEADPVGVLQVRCGWTDEPAERHERWALILANVVADAHFCAFLVSMVDNTVYFTGRRSNVQVAGLMFRHLLELARRLCAEELEKQTALPAQSAYTVTSSYSTTTISYSFDMGSLFGPTDPKDRKESYRLNWLEAFSRKIAIRYQQMKVRDPAEPGSALVLVGVRQQAQAAANSLATGKQEDLPEPASANHPDYEAQISGSAAGAKAPLSPNTVKSNT